MQAPTIDDIRAGWDGVASGFDRHDTPHSMRLAEAALEKMEVGPRTRFLDVAAGTGALAIPAARRGAQVTAVDLSSRMIGCLRARVKDEGLDGVDAQVMDGNHLDFPADTFDVAGSVNGVSVFPDMDGGLAEMVRVTRPGGLVAVVAFGPLPDAQFIAFVVAAMKAAIPQFPGLPSDPPPPPFQVADPAEMRRRLTAAGCDDVSVEPLVWEMRTEGEDPAQQLWDGFVHSNPIGAQLAAGLSVDQQAEVKRVLAGMLAERADESGVTTLTNAMNVGLGRPTR